MIYFQTIYISKRDEMASAPVVDRASDGDDDDDQWKNTECE